MHRLALLPHPVARHPVIKGQLRLLVPKGLHVASGALAPGGRKVRDK